MNRSDLAEYRRFASGVSLRVLGMLASLASVVIISRGLGVEGRGILYTCTSAASVAGVILALGMNSAVILVVAPRPALARRAIRRALAASMGAAGVVLVAGLVLREAPPAWMPASVITLIPIVAGMAGTQILLWWSSSLTQALGAVDAIPVIELIYRTATVAWGGLALFVLKITLIQFLGSLVALDAIYGGLWLMYVRSRAPEPEDLPAWPREWRRWSIRAYLPYGLYTGMRRIDAVILTSLAGPAATGLYSVATQTLDMCQIAPVFLSQKAIFAFSSGRGDSSSIRWLRRALPVAVLAAMLVAGLTARGWVTLLLGPQFAGCGLIILGLAAGGAAIAWQTVAVQEINAAGFPLGLTLAWLASFSAMAALFFAVVPRFGAVGGSAAFSVSYVLLAVLVYWLRARVRKRGQVRTANANMA
jgi:O-antigen/teichoic acid export membrane protein